MVKDKNGNDVNFGDKLRVFRSDGTSSYTYTVEEIDSDGWTWGSDLPFSHRYTNYDYKKNFHNTSMCCERVERKPWGTSSIQFHFT